MTHTYELRRFEDDGSMTTVLKIAAEPKYAKQDAKTYAKRNPGLYTLYKIETIESFFTENLDKKAKTQ